MEQQWSSRGTCKVRKVVMNLEKDEGSISKILLPNEFNPYCNIPYRI